MTSQSPLGGRQPIEVPCESELTAPHEALLPAPEHVLSTLERDGTRRWIFPKLVTGFWWHRRRLLAYILMVVFLAVPHIQIAERPLFRIDLIQREFTFFGYTFFPTDTLLLALLLLSGLICIVFLTAVTGRVWCGWACPQTVYMEFLFRPIDRLFEGTRGKGGKAKVELSFPLKIARLAVYLLLSMVLAHTFLAYFVGPQQLTDWILHSSPLSHPAAFIVMTVTTLLMTFDFYYFREQTCLIACPYGRFQSVMLDRQSLIVAYDYNRGEPRAKGRRDNNPAAKGDCVDCGQCTVVCPTGIDIRNGLQMECINCTQCIDACDVVMNKVGLPTGLIRYSSQAALEQKSKRILRPRTIIYPLLLLGVLTGFVFALKRVQGFTAEINRGKGTIFSVMPASTILNRFSLQLTNRSRIEQIYSVQVLAPESASIEVVELEQLKLNPRQRTKVPVNITFPMGLTVGSGKVNAVVRVTDQTGLSRDVDFKLLGPKGN
jgi:cytochrome c oxidase accessory protein FixG